MVCPTLISVADVPGPYLGSAVAAPAIRQARAAAAPRLLRTSMLFPPVAFLLSFHGHAGLAHDRLVALAFGRDEISEFRRRAADRDAALRRDHRAHAGRGDGTDRLLAQLLQDGVRHVLRTDQPVPRHR